MAGWARWSRNDRLPAAAVAGMLAARQVGAATADHGDRDHENERGDRGGDQEGPVEPGRQRVPVCRCPLARGRQATGSA
jgi:hypothetical protein